MKIILCKGLPGSGKSTWAKEYVKENPGTIRVNRDDIKAMLGYYQWTKKFEMNVVLKAERAAVRGALKIGLDVIIDDTNLNPKTIEAWRKLAAEYKADLGIKEFDTPLDECIRRDYLRDRTVGEEVIRGMYEKYCKG